MYNETVLLTSVIEALEDRDVTVTDILDSYFTMGIDEEVHMVLERKLAQMIVLIAPKVYHTYVITSKNGKLIIYVKYKKSLYGCLCSTLLFWKKLSG